MAEFGLELSELNQELQQIEQREKSEFHAEVDRRSMGHDSSSNHGRSAKVSDRRLSNFRGAVKSHINMYEETASSSNTHGNFQTPMRERM